MLKMRQARRCYEYDVAGRVHAIVVFVVRRLFCGRSGSCSSVAGRRVSVEDQYQGFISDSKMDDTTAL